MIKYTIMLLLLLLLLLLSLLLLLLSLLLFIIIITIIIIIIIIVISPFNGNTIQTLSFKLFDKLIWLDLAEDLQILSSSTNQPVK